jgi:hypothetical protein
MVQLTRIAPLRRDRQAAKTIRTFRNQLATKGDGGLCNCITVIQQSAIQPDFISIIRVDSLPTTISIDENGIHSRFHGGEGDGFAFAG